MTESEAEWAAGLDAGEIVDTRNWELMPSIGGSRRDIQDLPHLKVLGDTPEGILGKIAVERAFGKFLAGEQVEIPVVELEKVSTASTISTVIARDQVECRGLR